jgi:hypothetical protein
VVEVEDLAVDTEEVLLVDFKVKLEVDLTVDLEVVLGKAETPEIRKLVSTSQTLL